MVFHCNKVDRKGPRPRPQRGSSPEELPASLTGIDVCGGGEPPIDPRQHRHHGGTKNAPSTIHFLFYCSSKEFEIPAYGEEMQHDLPACYTKIKASPGNQEIKASSGTTRQVHLNR